MAIRIAASIHASALVLTAMVLTLASCARKGGGWMEVKAEAAASDSLLNITGTVEHMEIEGGLFVIRDAGGNTYNPTNLPEAFRVKGLAVEVVAQRRDDMASIGMVGQLVEVVRIRKRPP